MKEAYFSRAEQSDFFGNMTLWKEQIDEGMKDALRTKDEYLARFISLEEKLHAAETSGRQIRERESQDEAAALRAQLAAREAELARAQAEAEQRSKLASTKEDLAEERIRSLEAKLHRAESLGHQIQKPQLPAEAYGGAGAVGRRDLGINLEDTQATQKLVEQGYDEAIKVLTLLQRKLRGGEQQ